MESFTSVKVVIYGLAIVMIMWAAACIIGEQYPWLLVEAGFAGAEYRLISWLRDMR
jgi:hypothetical protein